MNRFKYIIVGGGIAAYNAIKAIREHDKEGSLALISAEDSLPYDRPTLSKDLWLEEDMSTADIKHELDGLKVNAFLGHRVTELEPDNKTLACDKDMTFHFDKLLIATGGEPITLDNAPQEVLYYRSLADYKNLRKLSEEKTKFAVIGGGYIGPELAASLSANGNHVSLIFPEAGISAERFPEALVKHINNNYERQGIDLIKEDKVASVERAGEGFRLKSHKGKELEVEAVVAGLGIRPAIAFAEEAGLETENEGLWVDDYLQTSQADIYAAGDIASFHNLALDKRMRIEHEDAARSMGKTAGANMAGANKRYDYLPYFYSDMFDMGYEAVGELNSELDTMIDKQDDFDKAVVYYLKDDEVKGVLLWNVWEKIDEARALIRSGESFNKEALKGKIALS
ncbi:MAG: NAD(P)/FAD-dependent oxidoreductase [Trueperaceae bacterium]|nr:NAD(P)/FAD-dependent oxidoreductase [Trueperaceae bacterium]